MNKGHSTLLNYSGLAALIVAGVVAFNSFSKTSEKIVVLDVEKVKTDARVFKKINTEAEKHISALKARAGEDEKVLQAEALALKKRIDESGKQAKDFMREIEAINQKVTVARNKVQLQSQLISRATQSALMQINPVTDETLKEFSAQNSITVILPKSVITYNVEAVDVTADFIKMLNKKDVNVVYPDPAQFTSVTPEAAAGQRANAPMNRPVAPAQIPELGAVDASGVGEKAAGEK